MMRCFTSRLVSRLQPLIWTATLGALSLLCGTTECLAQERAEAPLVIYSDDLASGWNNWSWANHSLTSSLHVHKGLAAISMEVENWNGLLFQHRPIGTSGYGTLQMYIYGSASLMVALISDVGAWGPQIDLDPYRQPVPEAGGGWTVVRIPLQDLGLRQYGGIVSGIAIQAIGEPRQPDAFIDDISFLPDLSLPRLPTQTTVTVEVLANSGRHAISPYIYGMAWAPREYVSDLRLGLNRWGGNAVTRYNWVAGNATSAARDWEWRNRLVMDTDAPPGLSSAADRFFMDNRDGGAASLLTIPTIGWVARDNNNNNVSLDVPYEGNAPLTDADGAIAGYDPTANRLATCIPSYARKGRPLTLTPSPAEGAVYQDEWVHHLTKKFGTAWRGGVKFYSMDNEPDLWDSTHTDIHPARMGYDDLLARFLEYASAVKARDPSAMITGPVAWGWSGYWFSPLDRGDDNFGTLADFHAHGDEPFLLWFLKQCRASDAAAGQRRLNVLDVHFYPQGGGMYGGSLDSEAKARRLRSTRALWDRYYVDESWIAQPVQLIPRLKKWIAEGYPGTYIGISEWNFGADEDINGALAIAEVLGIYGRENIYLANYWMYPPADSPGYLAFKLFRNADGLGHGFGDMACLANSRNLPRVSSFAATDTATGDMTVMLINKTLQTTATIQLYLTGFHAAATPVQMWRLTADNPHAIVSEVGPSVENGFARVTLPPSSITLIRVAKGG